MGRQGGWTFGGLLLLGCFMAPAWQYPLSPRELQRTSCIQNQNVLFPDPKPSSHPKTQINPWGSQLWK